MAELPTGTVTLVFTDIEGSTRMLERIGARYEDVLAEHHQLLRAAVSGSGGREIDVQGDGFLFAFSRASDAVEAAVTAQRALRAERWPAGVELRVRVGIHTGQPTLGTTGYVGLDVHRAARIAAAAHGGQIVVSQTTRELLADDVDVSFRDLGEHRLKDLMRAQRLFQVVADGLEQDFPPPRSLTARPTNLPLQSTPLVGRDRELSELAELVGENRLLTLTGPGGIGKTRLALQVAADFGDDFRGGTYFVPLESTVDPALVTAAIASTVGVREAAGHTLADGLAERLAEDPVLLVLDTFEHLLEGAGAISSLLRRCETLRALATSREPLRVEAEQEYPVAALAEDEAVALFRERARAVKPDFELTDESEPAVRAICVRLDRLPLALELAAARVKLLPPRELLARLDQRLRVLTGGARDRPGRQQTLRGAIEWSYDLLEERERDLFARLAVFAGGWSLPAAENVCEADLDVLASLIDKSLVVQSEGPGGEARYSMLETIREYALERLQERRDREDLQRRHAEYFAEATVDAMTQRFYGDGVPTVAFQRLDADTDNLRAALAWAAETGSEHELRLATLFQLSPQVGPTEGRRLLADALARSTAGGTTRARALVAAGGLARIQGDFMVARTLFEEAASLYRETDDAPGLIEALRRLASSIADAGDLDGAQRLLDEADAVARAADDPQLRALVGGMQVVIPMLRGDLAEARKRTEQVLRLREQIGDEEGIAFARGSLAFIALVEGRTREALAGLQEALRFWRQVQYPIGIANTTQDLASAIALGGATEEAVEIFAAAEAFRRTRGIASSGPFSELEERAHAPVRQAAEDPAYRTAVDAGEAMTLDEAADRALAVARRLQDHTGTS